MMTTAMFSSFSTAFSREAKLQSKGAKAPIPRGFREVHGVDAFMKQFGGTTFNRGLYRVHHRGNLKKWTAIVCSAFPSYSGKIQCFAYDWLGRHFGLDFSRTKKMDPQVSMFDVGASEVLEIPAGFAAFHDIELVKHTDAALASMFFAKWLRKYPGMIAPDKCAGYKQPLFLGGHDGLKNLELIDIEVYWTITGQLLESL